MSVMLESFKVEPSTLTTLFVTIFVGLNCVADTLPNVTIFPWSKSKVILFTPAPTHWNWLGLEDHLIPQSFAAVGFYG